MKKGTGLRGRAGWMACILAVNLAAVLLLWGREVRYVNQSLSQHAQQSQEKLDEVMDRYIHSFRLFSNMLSREIEITPHPDDIWDYLKSVDAKLLEIEGETYDGLYLYYQGRYLYSWDIPYDQYGNTGYSPTQRPWYLNAVAGRGEIVFTPPYMSYANHYILSTISQLQPDGETVFAYDIKMGDIQTLASSPDAYTGEQMIIFDSGGTVIGSSNPDYLGGNLYATPRQAQDRLQQAQALLDGSAEGERREKLEEGAQSAAAFHDFLTSAHRGLNLLLEREQQAHTVIIGQKAYCAYLSRGEEYGLLILVPLYSMLGATVQVWLVPLLLVELLLVYGIGRVSKEQKNRELKKAYVELGQTQRRLELAMNAAQKAAAIDDMTGLMNLKSFRKKVTDELESMPPGECGILVMLDGDHFKAVNDNYGHMVGDEVIKLCAQMMIGRIRTADLASRLHGDEFAIFVTRAEDYAVAGRIMEDINTSIAQEAERRNLPAITLSSGAVLARHGDSYSALSKTADLALYRAKESHNGQFFAAPPGGL